MSSYCSNKDKNVAYKKQLLASHFEIGSHSEKRFSSEKQASFQP